MKSKMITNIILAYFLVLTVVLASQIPTAKEIVANEPLANELKYEDRLTKSVAFANGSAVILANGKEKLISNNAADVPFILNSSTYVPLKFFESAFGAVVSYDANVEKEETATVRYNNVALTYTDGSNVIKYMDSLQEKTVMNGAEAISYNNTMYIPIRGFADLFEKEIFFNNGLCVISSIDNIFDAEKEADLIEKLRNQVTGLPSVGSEEALKKLTGVDEGWDYGFKSFTNEIMVDDDLAINEVAVEESAEADAVSGAGGGSGDYSRTNVQVQGVDEADIVKTDGEYIYYINQGNNKLYIAKAENGVLSESAVVDMNEGFYAREIYINGNKLAVIGDENATRGSASANDLRYYSRCAVYVYDITDKQKPDNVRLVKVDGNYSSSRLVGNSIYMISNCSVASLYFNNRYCAPSYLDSYKSADENSVSYGDIKYFPGCTVAQYMCVSTINLEDKQNPIQVATYLGRSDDIYCSENNLYVALRESVPVSYNTNNYSYYNGLSGTGIYRFKLSPSGTEYTGKGFVCGSVLNQFSMDENNGYFRIATTYYDFKEGQNENNLFVLDSKLKVCGSVTGVAPGESIYSCRFMGNKAYMVTFEQVDPLFVIDLSNPQKPTILGALKIPGYSDYLHPYDENHLIGFGKDTFVYNDMAYYTGVKLSMFDVSDMENPKEMFTQIIGDRGSEADILYDHKSLLFDKEKNILAFPLTLSLVNDTYKGTGNIQDRLRYGSFAGQGAYVYSIDMNKGFVLKGIISHLADEDVLKSGNYNSDHNKYVKRILYIGEHIYTLSNCKIEAAKISNINEKTSELNFNLENNMNSYYNNYYEDIFLDEDVVLE